ncbi:hypothetical protein G6549_18395 [Bacillus sp. MM2020_1]|nr:hypothetical protein [Bacillus sp. MM2020_1]
MDTTTWILIYLGGALAGSMIPFMRVYFSHFHNLINLVISACLEGGKVHLYLGFSVLALVLWIRNTFGVICVLSVIVLLALPVYFRYQTVLVLPVNVNFELIIVHMSIFIASVLFVQSMIGAILVCKQSFMKRDNPKRKAALVQTKLIPTVVLGIILFGQTVFAGYFFAINFISLPFSLDGSMGTVLLLLV